MTKIERLSSMGFIIKRISKNWFFVRLYSNPEKIGYYIIFPMRIK